MFLFQRFHCRYYRDNLSEGRTSNDPGFSNMSYVVSMSLPFPPPKVKLLRGRRGGTGNHMGKEGVGDEGPGEPSQIFWASGCFSDSVT